MVTPVAKCDCARYLTSGTDGFSPLTFLYVFIIIVPSLLPQSKFLFPSMTRQLIPTGQHNRVFLAILTDSYSRSHSEKSGQEQQFEIPLLKSHSPKCSCLIIRVQMNSNPLTELHLILYESLFSRV